MREVPESEIHKIVADVLGLDAFDEAVFDERVERISIPVQFTVTVHLTDGTSVSREWEYPPFKHNFTPEQRKAHGILSQAGRGRKRK
jgi:hypothetical protein